MTSHPPPRWSQETKRWALLAIIAVSLGLIYYARSALGWLVIAALLAYLLQPLVNWLERRGTARSLAAVIALFIAMGVVFIIPAVLFPLLLSQFSQLVGQLINAGLRGLATFNAWMTGPQVIQIAGFRIDLSSLIQELQQWGAVNENGVYVPTSQDLLMYAQQALLAATSLLGSFSSIVTTLLSRTVSLAFSIFLLFFYTFYITVDGHKLKPWGQSLVKPEYLPEFNELGHRINRVWHAFFRGQLTLSLIIGGITLVVGLLIGLPSPLALAIIAGVMEAVPTIGPILAAIPAVILALAQGSSVLPVNNLTFALITLLAYTLIQQVENAVIVPRVMGKALELHPMIVLVGVVIGARFAGILGVFLAAPTLATLKILFQYTHAKILDLDPFPLTLEEEEARKEPPPPSWIQERLKTWWRQRKSSVV